jgi:hypothetical protein
MAYIIGNVAQKLQKFDLVLLRIYTLQKYWSPYTVAQYKKETVCEEKVGDA